jgi:hypothetical protein
MRPIRHSRALFTASIVCSLGLFACGGDSGKTEAAPANAAATATTPEHFESSGGKFAIDFPPTWRSGYRTTEHTDTVGGSRFVTEFVFKPDAAWKVEPRPLLVVRIFSKAAWEKVAARPGPAMALKLAERDDDVFAYSVPSSNPYRPGTPAAARFDELVLAVAAPGSLKLTPR